MEMEANARTASARVRKEAFLKATLALGSMTLTVLAAEVVVRAVDLPPKRLDRLYVAGYALSKNPVLRYEYKPLYQPTEAPYDEGHRHFFTNSAGFRDREFTVRKQPGVVRILTIGDSITAGNGIADVEDVYPRQLENTLNKTSPTVHYEVFNMGVGGYHTLQEVETLRAKGLQYSPDIVIVGFCVNDFMPEADGGVYGLLTQQLSKDHGNVLWETYRAYQSSARRLLDKSRLLFFLYHRLRVLRGEPEMAFLYERDVLRGKNPVEAGFELLAQLQGEHGFWSYVFLIPAFDKTFDQYAHTEIHQRVLEIGVRYPMIRTIDLLDDFKSRGIDSSTLTWDGLHPNELGHRMLAEMMAVKLTGTTGD